MVAVGSVGKSLMSGLLFRGGWGVLAQTSFAVRCCDRGHLCLRHCYSWTSSGGNLLSSCGHPQRSHNRVVHRPSGPHVTVIEKQTKGVPSQIQ